MLVEDVLISSASRQSTSNARTETISLASFCSTPSVASFQATLPSTGNASHPSFHALLSAQGNHKVKLFTHLHLMNLWEASLVLRKLKKGPVWKIHYITSMTHFKKVHAISVGKCHVPFLPPAEMGIMSCQHYHGNALQSLDLHLTNFRKPGYYRLFYFYFMASSFARQKQLLCELVLVFRRQFQSI